MEIQLESVMVYVTNIFRLYIDFFMACILSVRWIHWIITWLHHALLRPFHTIGLFLYPLDIVENHLFTDVFRVYKKTSGMKWVNCMMRFSFPLSFRDRSNKF